MIRRATPPQRFDELDKLVRELLDPPVKTQRKGTEDSSIRALIEPEYRGLYSDYHDRDTLVSLALIKLEQAEGRLSIAEIKRIARLTFDILMEDIKTDPLYYKNRAVDIAIEHNFSEEKVCRARVASARANLTLEIDIAADESADTAGYLRDVRRQIGRLQDLAGLTKHELQEVAMPVYEEFMEKGQPRNAVFVAIVSELDAEHVETAAEKSIAGYLQRGNHVGAVRVALEAKLTGRAEQLALNGYEVYLSNALVFAKQIMEKERDTRTYAKEEGYPKILRVLKQRLLHDARNAELVARLVMNRELTGRAFDLVQIASSGKMHEFIAKAAKL